MSARSARLFTAFALAVALVGCSAPTLDRTGAIRCGTDRGPGCPTGFSCRFGRCCPNDSADAGTCPSEIDGDGTVRCGSGAFCPGGLTCRFDRCCSSGPHMTGPCSSQRIGAACANSGSCGPGLECATGGASEGILLPGGYCFSTRPCNPMQEDACGELGVCLGGNCYARCTITSGATLGPCRNDAMGQFYTCQPISADPTSTAGICLPDCRTTGGEAAVCPPSTTCNEDDGFCAPTIRCTTINNCPNASYECVSGRCVNRYIPCETDAECNPNNTSPPSSVCRPHPNWTAMNGRVCALNTGDRRCTGTTCAAPQEVSGLRVTFPCVSGTCLIAFERF